ncbi:cardiolipin synthase [Neisseria sp. Ec49-e6-T10]|uniref:cardiolipin synthase n=1 Tax=Neisseria sp. Ec49-e6-T10 TaxID=3140744 RepID=UPI003EBEAB20
MTITLSHIVNWFLIGSYWFLVATVTLKILMKRRPNATTTAWLLVIYILPLVGIIAYLSFGELNIGKRRAMQVKTIWPNTIDQLNLLLKPNQNSIQKNLSTTAQPLFNLCQFKQGIPHTYANEIHTFTVSHDTMAQIIADIHSATDNIKMVFYIWSEGGFANDVATALCLAAKRGVNCQLMLDSAGSHHFFKSTSYKKMKNAGVHITQALPVSLLRLFFRRMDLRQHRKMVLIDNYIVYIGSMNMVDPRYFKQSAGVGEWVDLMIRMEGSICLSAQALYNSDWAMETRQPHLLSLSNTLPIETPSYLTQIIASGPGFSDDIIQQTLLSAVYSAQKQLILTTPYFVPSDDLFHAICTAAARGVMVYLIVPKKGDSKLTNWASHAFYADLLDAGVKIYEFEGGLLHTKSILIDKQLSLVGTVNLDKRSLWLNFEVTVAIDSAHFGKKLSKIQHFYLAQSTLLSPEKWASRSLFQRVLERLFYFFSPFL